MPLELSAIAQAEDAIDVLAGQLALAEVTGTPNIQIQADRVKLILDEIYRLQGVEELYEDALGAAEDRRFD